MANERREEEFDEFWEKEVDEQIANLIREERSICPHGNPVAECNACYALSDFMYDAAREDRMR